jgi:asparagine synthase (glutamine-hydrolysing)
VELLRDRLAHRGPDGEGLWDGGHVILGHRRLAVIEVGPEGAQPRVSESGALAYNGELYNDREVRTALAPTTEFRTRSDAETLLAAMDAWGESALPRLRGMFALAYVDRVGERLVLARDPLGIKPLYYAMLQNGGRRELVFASEIPAILAHPSIPPRPDWVTLSAYLTTIRTTLGSRTLFEHVRIVQPGEVLVFDLRDPELGYRRLELRSAWQDPAALRDEGGATAATRETLTEAVKRHLHADVPVCALLSGGLDSSILAALASGQLGESPAELRTYCSGCPGEADDDFHHAAMMARRLGTRHREAPVAREVFLERWPAMVEALGLPLSTPNEVAIHEVATTLRRDGMIVTLSGEGADELFCGYDAPLRMALAHPAGGEEFDGGSAILDDAAWIPVAAKAGVLVPDAVRLGEHDEILRAWYRGAYDAAKLPGDRVRSVQRLIRRVNLEGLLLRLDSATMLAGVEGRTPFADAVVADLADAIPTPFKFNASAGPPSTKLVLRRAFEAAVPGEILSRRKASFPLPFQEWAAGLAAELSSSGFAREVVRPEAIRAVLSQPMELWRLTWPLVNLALWGRRWWG